MDACRRKRAGHLMDSQQKHDFLGRSKGLPKRPAKQHTTLPASPAMLQMLLAFLSLVALSQPDSLDLTVLFPGPTFT